MCPPCKWNNRSMSVLVIDNDPDGANSTADLLTIYGYSAQAVYSADAALAAAAVLHPDAVVMDACLRGADVGKLADQLRGVCDRCPLLVAVTGVTGAREYCRKVGFDHFFLKPAEPADLDGILSTHVSSRSLSH
jgi:two-component system, OmpR family, response regulator